jgi:Flagellar biosynthesis protein, FliO
MSAETPKTRKATPRPRKRPSACAPELTVEANTFQESLIVCAQAGVSPGTAMETLSTPRQVKWLRWQAICSEALTRAWSFLHAKYKTSTTKRLHVSETISLGEKRFVAIVNVEGREFLIGGGVSGMSLLAQLGAAPRSSFDLGQSIGDSGGIL